MLTVQFKVPLEPPSVNSLYNVMFALRRVELKPEVRVFKTQFKQFVPVIGLKEDADYSLEIQVHGRWLTKEGKRRKRDVHNLAKCIQDVISEKVGVDDSVFQETCIKRIDNDETFILVKIREVSQHGEKVEV